MRSIELFAGAAGLGLGLATVGFKHEIVVERDTAACDTMRYNQARGHQLVKNWDIREADVANLDLSAVAPGPDLLAGGPPCQDYSLGGKHAGPSGNRNMWPWTVHAVKTLLPRAFAFENVPGLASQHRAYLDYLVMALTLPEIANPHDHDWAADAAYLQTRVNERPRQTTGYRVNVVKLTATDFGTAQNRSRLFIIGIREDIGRDWVMPTATHSAQQLLADKWITGAYWQRHGLARPELDDAGLRYLRKHNQHTSEDLFATRMDAHRTTRDAVGNLGEPGRDDACPVLDHEAAPRIAKAYKGHNGSRIDDPSLTLRAGQHGVSGGENMIDYGAAASAGRYRHMTVREAARIQDFPDDYAFPGTIATGKWSASLKQLGNAVPLQLAAAVGRSLATALN